MSLQQTPSLLVLLVQVASPSAVGVPRPESEPRSEASPPVSAVASVAWNDFDGDGRLDALSVTSKGWLLLLANREAGGFEDVTLAVGLADVECVVLALWGDYDGDRNPDLFVAKSAGLSQLFRNEGGSFVDVTEVAGLLVEEPVRAAHWLDEDGDGRLDLHVLAGGENRIWRGLEGDVFEPVELPLEPESGEGALGDPLATRVGSVAEDGEPAGVAPAPGVPLPRGGRRAPLLLKSSSSVSAENTAPSTGGSLSGASMTAMDTSTTGSSTSTRTLACAGSLQDQAFPGSCLVASSEAALGMLYPLSERLCVDEATGNVGVGTANPVASLHVSGDRGLLAQGSVLGPIPYEGGGPRMMWYPGKASFRAGTATTEWDDVNIDYATVALGQRTTASGRGSTAFGNQTTASGPTSTAMGVQTMASGTTSTALGISTTASEFASTAMGESTTAGGRASTALGLSTTADGLASTAIGRFNVGGGNSTTWVETDPLFEIGDGDSDLARSNAVTVLKSGRVGVGTNLPTADLHVDGYDGLLVTRTDIGGAIPAEGAGSRMMWYPAKSAFRAGIVLEDAWDDVNVGLHSAAFGIDTVASGPNSTALGNQTVASGNHSAALGLGSEASGHQSTAMGFVTEASGTNSTALGSQTRAVGTASTALGFSTLAQGDYSTALGRSTSASSYLSVVLGTWNAPLGGDPSNWIPTDPLFVVANGTDPVNRSNALTVLKNGSVGIGNPTPVAGLDVLSDLGVVATGTYAAGTIPATGPGARMMWYPGKAAFRAGRALASEWNDVNVGDQSVALGSGVTASGARSTALGSGGTAGGDDSTALGRNTSATGTASTAMGFATSASDSYSTALGTQTTASGHSSTAMGFLTSATGDSSSALGFRTTAGGTASTALGDTTFAASLASLATGRWNVGGGSPTDWIGTDPLFEIGIGSGPSIRINALTVLKNGNVGIGTASPAVPLEVIGDVRSQGALRSAGASGGEVISHNPANQSAEVGLSWLNDVARIRVGGNGTGSLNGLDVQTTGNTSLLRLLHSGRVGMGTTAPAARLHVDADGSGSVPQLLLHERTVGDFARLSMTVAGDPEQWTVAAGGAQSDLNFFHSGGSGNVVTLRPFNGGIVGIGRAPATNRLEVEGNASKTTAGLWLANSDRRIKREVRDLADPLAWVERVRPVAFRYTEEYLEAHPAVEDIEYFNVIAQEFAEVFPDYVAEDAAGILQVDTYPALIHALGAIQELAERNRALEARCDRLEAALGEREGERVDPLEGLAALEGALERIEKLEAALAASR